MRPILPGCRRVVSALGPTKRGGTSTGAPPSTRGDSAHKSFELLSFPSE